MHREDSCRWRYDGNIGGWWFISYPGKMLWPSGSLKCEARVSPAAAAYPMQQQSLRRATPADIRMIGEITRAAYAQWVAVIGREPKPMTADYARAVADHVIDLLEQDGQPVALIEAIPTPAYLLIENIAVLPDRHGRGIGGVLLRHADDLARSLGLNELRLYTNCLLYTSDAADDL